MQASIRPPRSRDGRGHFPVDIRLARLGFNSAAPFPGRKSGQHKLAAAPAANFNSAAPFLGRKSRVAVLAGRACRDRTSIRPPRSRDGRAAGGPRRPDRRCDFNSAAPFPGRKRGSPVARICCRCWTSIRPPRSRDGRGDFSSKPRLQRLLDLDRLASFPETKRTRL